jgi:hypothetical protein
VLATRRRARLYAPCRTAVQKRVHAAAAKARPANPSKWRGTKVIKAAG